MKVVERIREIEASLATFSDDYTIDYTYDASGNVVQELITIGTFTITNTFNYDTNGNISSEVKTFGKNIVTKTYTYTDGNVTKITITNTTVSS